MKGVGRNPKGDGKKKGGLKVHMLTDIHSDTPRFVKINDAKMNDKNFLQYLNPSKGSMIVFDRAYSHYLQFAKWTETGVNFVCRLKDKNSLFATGILQRRTGQKIQVYHKQLGNIR
jgi:hypothetical protein